jgi:hypothetical protein
MIVRLPSFAIPLALLSVFACLAPAPAAARDTDADVRALRAQLDQVKSDIRAMDARLRELEQRTTEAAASSPSGSRTAMERTSPATATPATAPAASTALTPGYTPSGPVLREAVDPAPYQAAIDARLSMFRVAMAPYRWIPAGKRQLVLFNTYDQAYLLDFANACPGLLYAKHIRIENFSTHVKIGEHAVVADGQRCLITDIGELRIVKLPAALRP